MANVPFPLTAEGIDDLKRQVYELIRQVFEEKIGGADLGDVFSLPGDVLTLVLAGSSGLTKEDNELAVDPVSTGGLQVATAGISIKILSTGGLETGATGLSIKLDGTSLTLSANGLKLTDPLNLTEITLNNDGLHLKDTDASHVLTISPGSNLTANRVLTLTTGDSARIITLSGNPTLADWFDQAVKGASSPVFAGLTLTGFSGTVSAAAGVLSATVLPKFSAHKNGTNQTISTGAWRKVTFTTEVYDVGSAYDAPNSNWIPGIIGKAHISAGITFGSHVDTKGLYISVYKNGAEHKDVFTTASGTGLQSTPIACDVLIDNILDYFEIYVYQDSGGDLTLNGNTAHCWFMGHMLP